MIKINYPKHDFRIKETDGKEWIFDEFRKQWVRLTPEEWVRQNILQYLTEVKKYPPALIAIEKEIQLGELKKRFDILIYKNALPWMIIECKEMNVPLNEPVLKQVLNYNISTKAAYIFITNGQDNYGFSVADETFMAIDELPEY